MKDTRNATSGLELGVSAEGLGFRAFRALGLGFRVKGLGLKLVSVFMASKSQTLNPNPVNPTTQDRWGSRAGLRSRA